MLKARSNFAIAIVLLALFWPASALAAGSLNGISISPFIQQISLAPGAPSQTFNLTLTNHTASLQELDLSAHDFGSLNDSGGIVLEGSSTYSQKYGLAAWLNLSDDTLNLNPGQSATVQVTINNLSSLQPGGHYGAIIASVNSFNQPASDQVAINQQLTSLILVDKQGGEHYDLKLDGVSQNGNWLHLPNDIRLTFQNPGNVHVIPRGLVKLKSPSGLVLAQGVINDASAFMLPESFRQFYVPLTPVNKQIPLPGIYSLEVDYRYDGINQYAVQNFKVHFIDLKAYLLIIVILLIVFWLWRRRRIRVKKTATTS